VSGMITSVYTVLNNGILSYFGERLKTASDKFYEATYFCNWLEQSLRFRKMLIIIRQNALQPLTIRAFGIWIYDHMNFWTVRTVSAGFTC
jgi:hypothetical protein